MQRRVWILVGLLTLSAGAATTIFDFETSAEAAALPYSKSKDGKTTLEVSPKFATVGERSLLFKSAQWKKGMPEWPAFTIKPALKDWSGFERLSIDFVNTEVGSARVSLFISDSVVPFREGLSATFMLTGGSFQRVEVPLSKFPGKVKRSDITIVHFFTDKPDTDMSVHFDNITLLKKGEKLSEPPPAFVAQLMPLAQSQSESGIKALSEVKQSVAPMLQVAELRSYAEQKMANLSALLERNQWALAGGEQLTLAQLAELQSAIEELPVQARRLESVLKFYDGTLKAGYQQPTALIGVASPMVQLAPRGAPFTITPTRTVDVKLARNERESVQIGVLPVVKDLQNARVRATDLVAVNGAVFAASYIDCDVTGYVETKGKPPYKVDYVGWWPDPILNFLGGVEVKRDDLQSFWIRFRAPRDQTPGEYRGKILVSADNMETVTLDLNVRVYGFSVPDEAPLPLAITFSPHDHPRDETRQAQLEWRKCSEYPINAWKKHNLAWGEFLADYYITFDSLYHGALPNFEVLNLLKKQGRLGYFNLGYWSYYGDDAAGETSRERMVKRLRSAYDKAKEYDLLDKAYIYGSDEVVAKYFSQVEKSAAAIRKACPGVPIMTTTYDHSFGEDTEIKSIDWFCPLTPRFDQKQVAKARKNGKQVWWYICCGPHHPHANMFIEYPAIEGRLLMGAMTARERPDGFLYYQISIWNSEKPITEGPFTTWDPRSWTIYHGDGAWTCVGADGLPLPTQRLENFRDGLEDYAYFLELERLIAQHTDSADVGWLTLARQALEVPETLVKSMKEYSRDPTALYAWRERLANAIESAPTK